MYSMNVCVRVCSKCGNSSTFVFVQTQFVTNCVCKLRLHKNRSTGITMVGFKLWLRVIQCLSHGVFSVSFWWFRTQMLLMNLWQRLNADDLVSLRCWNVCWWLTHVSWCEYVMVSICHGFNMSWCHGHCL
jgi:hypothetical protein